MGFGTHGMLVVGTAALPKHGQAGSARHARTALEGVRTQCEDYMVEEAQQLEHKVAGAQSVFLARRIVSGSLVTALTRDCAMRLKLKEGWWS